MSFAPHDYLKHILDECDFLLGAAVRLRREEFLENATCVVLSKEALKSLVKPPSAYPRIFVQRMPICLGKKWLP